jgi:hypothetical protein
VVRRQADAIRVRASRIKDAALRASFLGRIPENARMLELARAFDRAPA